MPRHSNFNIPDWRKAKKEAPEAESESSIIEGIVPHHRIRCSSEFTSTGTDRPVSVSSVAIETPSTTLEAPSAALEALAAHIETPSTTIAPPSATIETPSAARRIGKVSFFDHNRQRQPSGALSVAEVAESVKSDPRLATLTAEVRNALAASGGDKRSDKVVKAKAKLPAVAVSGTVTQRSGAEGLVHSGLVQVDIDELTAEEVRDCKAVVANDSSAVLVFVSPTGTGVKAMVHVDPSGSEQDVEAWHANAFASVERHFLETYGIRIDPAPKNPASLMYLCHDPEPAGHGEDAAPLTVVEPCLGASEPSSAPDFSEWAEGQGYTGDLRTLDAKKLVTETELLIKTISAKKISIKCPWESEHTTASTGSDTVLLLNPDAPGVKVSFKCQHGHCEHRTIRDFLGSFPREIVDRCCLAPYQKSKLRSGIELPRDNRLVSEFAEDLGLALKEFGVFVRGGLVMVVYKGESVIITPDFMRTWCEAYLYTYTRKGQGDDVQEVSRTMSTEVAKAALSAPQFINQLPELVGISPVQAPVIRASGVIELLPMGYDPETKILTLETAVKFDTDWSLERGCRFLDDLLTEFPFAKDGGRSKAVAIAAMLTVFAPLLISRHSPRPAFIYVANSEGSGKTLLAQLAGATHGIVSVTSAPKTDEEWQKKILANVISGASFLLLDNVKGFLDSPSLEALLSSSKYEGRVLGLSKIYKGDVNMVVIITGNNLTVTPDMARRALFVELFSETLRAEDRVYKRVLDGSEILRLQPHILASLWSLVAAWDCKGRPQGSIGNASFTRWAMTFGGILESAGYINPCMRPEIEGMADPDVTDMVKLAKLVQADEQLSFDLLASKCKNEGLFERATVEVDDVGSLTRKGKSILARIFKRFSGKLVAEGLRFSVTGAGHRRSFSFKRLGAC